VTVTQPSAVPALGWKYKYRKDWPTAKEREDAVIHTLKELRIPVIRTGYGSGTTAQVEGYHISLDERYDLKAPQYGAYFEVTGTTWTKAQSEERFGYPVLAILCQKVEDAKAYGVLSQLYFAQVCESEGEILFIPATECSFYRRGFYSNGEAEYFLIPWSVYRPPRWLLTVLKKVVVQEAVQR
jgi:hypothetical protein